MTTRTGVLICLLNVFGVTNAARADLHIFQPTPADLFDLDHKKFYKWGINWDLPANESIISASLSFDNIDNWQVENDILYIVIRNSAAAGISVHNDNQGGGNNFPNNDNNDVLATYTDLEDNGAPEDLSVPIPSHYFAWLSDGNFGFGFDPDCHYWNDGIKLIVQTGTDGEQLPVPGAALLGAIGAGLVYWLRRNVRI